MKVIVKDNTELLPITLCHILKPLAAGPFKFNLLKAKKKKRKKEIPKD